MKKSSLENCLITCLFVITVVLFTFSGNATNYYVSSSGNDANLGTTESLPWRSLTKVNSFIPRPGDAILFRSGDEWAGTIAVKASGNVGNPIIYGAYGTGAKPKIYGSEKITGWTQYSGNIYKATFETPITQLFLDGVRMKAARYPNTGYIRISTVNSPTQITCNTLPGGIDFTGSKLSIRTNNWRVDTRSVTASTSNTLTFDSPASYALTAALEFFLCNKLQFLDAAGEWYYDGVTKSVYLWSPAGDSPENHVVRGSVYNSGIIAQSKDYITIRGLDISQHSETGVDIKGNYTTIDNNYVFGTETKGINNVGSYNTVTGNLVNGINHVGIALSGSNSSISDNEVLNTALFENLGLKGMQGYSQVIAVSGNFNFIRYNKIANAAYNGITWFGLNNIIEFNYIDAVCSILNDGGAIYTYSADINKSGVSGSIVRGNIVLNLPEITYAIYMDHNTRDVLIEKNTVAHCQNIGIYVHFAKNIVVRNNTLFDIPRGMKAKGTYGGNTFTNNIACNISTTTSWYNNRPINPSLAQINSTENTITLNNNLYIDHHRKSVFMNTVTSNFIDFNQWKTSTGQDVNSSFDGTTLGTGEVEKLFYNRTKQVMAIDLGVSVYRDIVGNLVSGTLNLEPFASRILVKTTSIISLDTIAPSISSFTIPSTSSVLSVPISSFIATDNEAVAGYKLTETSIPPLPSANGWTTSVPASYIFSSAGTKTLYAWAKDKDGNVSVSLSVTVTITLSGGTSSSSSEYLFEELSGTAVIDSQGPNDGTFVNDVLRSNGVRGGGLEFTGRSYVSLGQCFGDNVQDAVTISAWIKPTAISGSWQGIIMHEGPNVNTFALYINTDLKSIAFKTSGTLPDYFQWIDIWNLNSLWDGKWHQVSATYDGSQKVIYLDGVAIKTVKSTGNIESGIGYNLILGSPRDDINSTSMYKGLMDEARIYNYALTSSEIANLFKPVNTPFSEYLFEELSGTTVVDSQGPNDGTFVNDVLRSNGVRGGGLEFTGRSYVSLGQCFGDNVQDAVTISAWIKPTATNGSWQGIIMHEGPNVNTFALYINTDLKSIAFKTSGTLPDYFQWIDIWNLNSLWDGKWHQVSATYDGSQKVIYLDGVAIKTVKSTGNIESGIGYNLILGSPRDNINSKPMYKGLMDEARIYNYALTSSEVAGLFTLGNSSGLKSATIAGVQSDEPSLEQSVESNNKLSDNLSDKNFANQLGHSDFILYPNPAKSLIYINFPFLPERDTRIVLIDGNGKTVLTKLVDSTTNRIDISQFSAGLYYLKLCNHQRNIIQKLIIYK